MEAGRWVGAADAARWLDLDVWHWGRAADGPPTVRACEAPRDVKMAEQAQVEMGRRGAQRGLATAAWPDAHFSRMIEPGRPPARSTVKPKHGAKTYESDIRTSRQWCDGPRFAVATWRLARIGNCPGLAFGWHLTWQH